MLVPRPGPWAVLALLYAGHMAIAFNRGAMDAAVTQIVASGAHGFVGADGDSVAMASVCGAMCGNLAGAALARHATRRIGSKMSFVASLLAPALCSAAIAGVAAAGRTSVPSMVALWFGARAAEALLRPSMVDLMNDAFPRASLGRAWGVLSTSSRAGAVLGGLVFSAQLLHGAAWSALFQTACAALVVCALLAVVCLPAAGPSPAAVRGGPAEVTVTSRHGGPGASFWFVSLYAAGTCDGAVCPLPTTRAQRSWLSASSRA